MAWRRFDVKYACSMAWKWTASGKPVRLWRLSGNWSVGVVAPLA